MPDNSEFILGPKISTPLKGTEYLQTNFPSESPIFANQSDELAHMDTATDENLRVSDSAVLSSERC